jgi:transketolase
LKTQRDVFLDSLFDKAKNDSSIMLLSVDMGAPAIDRWKLELPDQYIEMGISEQNAINVAAGLSRGGKKVFVYFMAVWVHRCFEQIRYSCAIGDNPITILGNSVGLGYAPAGPAHEPNEDISVMRSLHNLQIHSASSIVQIEGVLEQCLNSKIVNYVRLERKTYPDSELAYKDFLPGFYSNSYLFHDDKLKQKYAVLSYGQIMHRLFNLREKYPVKLSEVSFIELSRIWPLDFDTLFMQLGNINKVLFVEEQSKSGSLSEVLAFEFASRGLLLNLKTIHLPNSYIFENGNQEEILDSIGFSSSDILDQIELLMV